MSNKESSQLTKKLKLIDVDIDQEKLAHQTNTSRFFTYAGIIIVLLISYKSLSQNTLFGAIIVLIALFICWLNSLIRIINNRSLLKKYFDKKREIIKKIK